MKEILAVSLTVEITSVVGHDMTLPHPLVGRALRVLALFDPAEPSQILMTAPEAEIALELERDHYAAGLTGAAEEDGVKLWPQGDHICISVQLPCACGTDAMVWTGTFTDTVQEMYRLLDMTIDLAPMRPEHLNVDVGAALKEIFSTK